MTEGHAQQPEETEDGPPLPRAGTEDNLFAANIRETRTRLGMSQGELARRMSALGWPWYQQTVRRVEEGSRRAGVGEAKAIARIFGTTVDRLTMPGRQAVAAALLESGADKAGEAWEQIAEWTAALLRAQRQLTVVVAETERADCKDAPPIVRLLDDARRALALAADSAVTDGAARLQEAGD